MKLLHPTETRMLTMHAVCTICHKVTAGTWRTKAKAGTVRDRYPRRHQANGVDCPGARTPALLMKCLPDHALIPRSIVEAEIAAVINWARVRIEALGGDEFPTAVVATSMQKIDGQVQARQLPLVEDRAKALVYAARAYLDATPAPASRKGGEARATLWNELMHHKHI